MLVNILRLYDFINLRIFTNYRWLGIRPKSGRWHRKDGRFGRKIRPIKKMITHTTMKIPRDTVYRMYSS